MADKDQLRGWALAYGRGERVDDTKLAAIRRETSQVSSFGDELTRIMSKRPEDADRFPRN